AGRGVHLSFWLGFVLTIAHVSDSHVRVYPDLPSHYTRTPAENLEACVANLNAMRPRPDVVVHTGDITDNGTAAQLHRAKCILGALQVPCYPILGNHDGSFDAFVSADLVPENSSRYASAYGYSVPLGESQASQLIMLDSTFVDNRGKLAMHGGL